MALVSGWRDLCSACRRRPDAPRCGDYLGIGFGTPPGHRWWLACAGAWRSLAVASSCTRGPTRRRAHHFRLPSARAHDPSRRRPRDSTRPLGHESGRMASIRDNEPRHDQGRREAAGPIRAALGASSSEPAGEVPRLLTPESLLEGKAAAGKLFDREPALDRRLDVELLDEVRVLADQVACPARQLLVGRVR
jgi:hypothetical protein